MKHARAAEAVVALALVSVGCALLWSYPVALIVAGVLILADRITS